MAVLSPSVISKLPHPISSPSIFSYPTPLSISPDRRPSILGRPPPYVSPPFVIPLYALSAGHFVQLMAKINVDNITLMSYFIGQTSSPMFQPPRRRCRRRNRRHRYSHYSHRPIPEKSHDGGVTPIPGNPSINRAWVGPDTSQADFSVSEPALPSPSKPNLQCNQGSPQIGPSSPPVSDRHEILTESSSSDDGEGLFVQKESASSSPASPSRFSQPLVAPLSHVEMPCLPDSFLLSSSTAASITSVPIPTPAPASAHAPTPTSAPAPAPIVVPAAAPAPAPAPETKSDVVPSFAPTNALPMMPIKKSKCASKVVKSKRVSRSNYGSRILKRYLAQGWVDGI